jgi:hypothetical protein
MPRSLAYRVLGVAAVALMAVGYFSPIWWVSLKAPNYPEQTFPDGVRIHLHYNGVQNGCRLQQSDEIDEEEPLDCVHEMNTINHYIGMQPIEKGAQIEFAAAPYLFVAFGALALLALVYSGPLWWVLAIPGILLPIGFVVDFAAWLWWFGHNLHPWAAFTVKPFMPTVLGQGKVAQFSTFSYPHYGMALITLSAIGLLLAVLIKRRLLLDRGAEA